MLEPDRVRPPKHPSFTTDDLNTDGSVALVPRASWEAVCQERAQLEDKLKQKDKRILRLRQVSRVAAKTAKFHEALSAILGIKLALYDNGQVWVTSQNDLIPAFVFQPDLRIMGEARMQLVAQGEGGSQELPELMRNWVEIEQGMPYFLVSVKLECCDKWKLE
jgi:mitotic spindle assembly checkpoint protein MAD1